MDKNYWLAEPEEHDFPSAQDFLKLHFLVKNAKLLAERLKKSKTVIKFAKMY